MKSKSSLIKRILIAVLLAALSIFLLLVAGNRMLKGTPIMYGALLLSYSEQEGTVEMQVKLPDNEALNDKIYTVDVAASGGIDTNGTLPFRQKGDPAKLRYPYLVYIYADTLPPEDTSGVLAVKYIESATT